MRGGPHVDLTAWWHLRAATRRRAKPRCQWWQIGAVKGAMDPLPLRVKNQMSTPIYISRTTLVDTQKIQFLIIGYLAEYHLLISTHACTTADSHYYCVAVVGTECSSRWESSLRLSHLHLINPRVLPLGRTRIMRGRRTSSEENH